MCVSFPSLPAQSGEPIELTNCLSSLSAMFRDMITHIIASIETATMRYFSNSVLIRHIERLCKSKHLDLLLVRCGSVIKMHLYKHAAENEAFLFTSFEDATILIRSICIVYVLSAIVAYVYHSYRVRYETKRRSIHWTCVHCTMCTAKPTETTSHRLPLFLRGRPLSYVHCVITDMHCRYGWGVVHRPWTYAAGVLICEVRLPVAHHLWVKLTLIWISAANVDIFVTDLHRHAALKNSLNV